MAGATTEEQRQHAPGDRGNRQRVEMTAPGDRGHGNCVSCGDEIQRSNQQQEHQQQLKRRDVEEDSSKTKNLQQSRSKMLGKFGSLPPLKSSRSGCSNKSSRTSSEKTSASSDNDLYCLRCALKKKKPAEIAFEGSGDEVSTMCGESISCSSRSTNNSASASPKSTSKSVSTSVSSRSSSSASTMSSDTASSTISMLSPPPSGMATPAASMTAYKGPVNEHDQAHGQGCMRWENGDVYQGEFFNGVRHGNGSLVFSSGGEYVGDWECNQIHGNGTRRFPNLDVYTGPYVRGQRSGEEGRFYFANGDLYVGAFKGDQMHGFGRYYYCTGQRFEGSFHKGERHGVGKSQHTDGKLDFFLYEHNQRIGRGVRFSPDRKKAWLCHTKGRRLKELSVEQALEVLGEMENEYNEVIDSASPNKGSLT